MLRLTTLICAFAACMVALAFLILVQLEPVLVNHANVYAPAFFCLAMLTVVPLAWRGGRRMLLRNRLSN